MSDHGKFGGAPIEIQIKPWARADEAEVLESILGQIDTFLHVGWSTHDETVAEARLRLQLPANPLDFEYDGVKLRDLVKLDEFRRSDGQQGAAPGLLKAHRFTPTQRAAVSAHWSAQLRAKVQASAAADKEREQRRVVVDSEED